jgi:DNA-binding NarL/FixJ family response regulator
MKTQFAGQGRGARDFTVHGVGHFLSLHAGSRTILFISNDRQLHDKLRSFANAMGILMIRAERSAGAVAILQATRPVAVLLDLDLADEAAWETAELLLSAPGCPAVILLTGRTVQFDVQTAIRAGPLVSKTESTSRVFEIVEEALEMPAENQAERNAIQRVLIRRLRPSELAESNTPAHRFWGINE